MGVLHDQFDHVFAELCTDTNVKAELVRSVFVGRGIKLTDTEFQSLVKAIEDSGDADYIQVPIDRFTETINVTSDEIERAFTEFEDKLDNRIQGAIKHALEHMAPSILESLHAALPEALNEWRAAQAGFEERLHKRWQAGLDRLEMLIVIAHEAGETYVNDLQFEPDSEIDSEDSILLNVLVRLHCRACRTAREILCLMKSGYADGAYARWRALHEIAVTAWFLSQHRGDTPQRYLDHADVMNWRNAQEYQEHCHALGYEPYSTEELDEMRTASDTAIGRYGRSFEKDYGWAARALGDARPTFRKIEASLDMSQWRPHFQFACQSVHAGSQALFFSLASSEQAEEILFAGASDAGLADPGHHAAISLMMTTVALLTSRPNLDGLVSCQCLLKLCDEIGEAVLQSHNSD